jgi:hypothetical protein
MQKILSIKELGLQPQITLEQLKPKQHVQQGKHRQFAAITPWIISKRIARFNFD